MELLHRTIILQFYENLLISGTSVSDFYFCAFILLFLRLTNSVLLQYPTQMAHLMLHFREKIFMPFNFIPKRAVQLVTDFYLMYWINEKTNHTFYSLE